MHQIRRVTLSMFKSRYSSLIRDLYSPEEIINTFEAKIALLNPILIGLLGGKTLYLISPDSCALIRISKNYCYVGYLEAKNKEAYAEMLDYCHELCRTNSANPIMTPVDLSLWFQHRLENPTIESYHSSYYSQPISKSWYWEALVEKATVMSSYFTAARFDWQFILNENQDFALKFEIQGYALDIITPGIKDLPLIYTMYRMSAGVFNSHLGFENISFGVFLLSKILIPSRVPTQVMVLRKGKYICGFLTFYIQNLKNQKTLILKTVLILPKYRGRGLTRYFSYLAHQYASKNGCSQVFYSTILSGNKVSGMDTRNVSSIGEYSLFQIR